MLPFFNIHASLIRMYFGFNSKTLQNPQNLIISRCIVLLSIKLIKGFKKNTSNPGRATLGYGRAAAEIDRVSELYPEDILKNPVCNGMVSFQKVDNGSMS